MSDLATRAELIAAVLSALSAADRLGEVNAALHLNEALISLGHPGVPPRI